MQLSELFYIDDSNDSAKSWEDLLTDLAKTNSYNQYIKVDDYYDLFKSICLSLLNGGQITLLDDDLSDFEVVAAKDDIDHGTIAVNSSHLSDKISTKDTLLSHLNQPEDSWRISLFTSGTTGKPKKITHDFNSICRFIRKDYRGKEQVWGMAYNPTHMAGIQVFFQALLNGFSIVRLFGLSSSQIHQTVSKRDITHISATPTFYRLNFDSERVYQSVVRISSGGEKFDQKLQSQLQSIFPKAKINNIYASTEAGTLLGSNGEFFTIKKEYSELMKIENNELLIHRSLLGKNDVLKGDWYHSGDLVEFTDKGHQSFKFVARRNQIISIGGYQVSPGEVEEALRSHPGIIEARVYSKKNSVLGNIMACDVMRKDDSLTEVILRLWLSQRLQEFKVPRIIKFMDEFNMTRTGKIKRNNL